MKQLRIQKKYWILLILNGVLVLSFCGWLLAYHLLAGRLLHEDIASVWAGESDIRYSQVSCFLPVNSTLDEAAIATFRTKVEEKLLEASMEAEDGKSLYVDAYSAETTLTLKNGSNSATVKALGVGGDYFFFHSLYLQDGSYLTVWDLMQDRVVLDENTAWNLFGSFDVAGMQVTINNQPYLVAGVVSHNHDRSSQLAEADSPAVVYVDYSVIAETSPITCYEIVMPDPISEFAYTVVEESFPLGDHGQLLENSTRFQVGRITKLLFSYGKRLMIDDGVAYPTWENAARYTEARLCLVLLATAFSAVIPLVSLVGVIVYWYKKLYRYIKQKIDDRRITA